MGTLLSKGTTNAKTKKNKLETFILYLSPYNLNSMGFNICPSASPECAKDCLFYAGMGSFSNVQKARQNKTEYFLRDKKAFMLSLSYEIMKQYTKAKKQEKQIAFRLNGTSDLDFVYLLKKYANLDIETLKDYAVFYDYSKVLSRTIRYKDHKNYFVTFSRSEINDNEVNEAIKQKINVAVVFNGDFPKKYKGVKVIYSDASDLLTIYNKGVILGLQAKGSLRKSKGTFAINTELPF